MQSGSLISARLSAEQGKQVFVVPSRIDNINAEGCHHLIREGATLIYHPTHILEDIGANLPAVNALPKTFSQKVALLSETANSHQAGNKPNDVMPTTIPTHLMSVMDALGDELCDLDKLVARTQKSAGELLAGLMELEMMGQVVSMGGRFKKA